MPAPTWMTETLSVGVLGMSWYMTPVLKGRNATAPRPFSRSLPLDATPRVVLGLALFPDEADTVDAPIALVEERVVVCEAVGQRDAARGVGARPVDQQGDEELPRLGAGRPGEWPDRQNSCEKRCGEPRHNHRAREHYSMTWSARCTTDGGTVRPMAFAVLTLTLRTNLAGRSTGISAIFAPLRMRSTYCAHCRHIVEKSGPYASKPPDSG